MIAKEEVCNACGADECRGTGRGFVFVAANLADWVIFGLGALKLIPTLLAYMPVQGTNERVTTDRSEK